MPNPVRKTTDWNACHERASVADIITLRGGLSEQRLLHIAEDVSQAEIAAGVAER
jgi:hypothetical protein